MDSRRWLNWWEADVSAVETGKELKGRVLAFWSHLKRWQESALREAMKAYPGMN